MSVATKGREGVFQVKQNKGLFPKDYIEKALEDAPGGVKIVLTGTAPNNIPLVALGYSYSRKTTLFFIMTSKAGSTTAGSPYIMKYTDGFGNLCQWEVERPEVISTFLLTPILLTLTTKLGSKILLWKRNGLLKILFFILQLL